MVCVAILSIEENVHLVVLPGCSRKPVNYDPISPKLEYYDIWSEHKTWSDVGFF